MGALTDKILDADGDNPGWLSLEWGDDLPALGWRARAVMFNGRTAFAIGIAGTTPLPNSDMALHEAVAEQDVVIIERTELLNAQPKLTGDLVDFDELRLITTDPYATWCYRTEWPDLVDDTRSLAYAAALAREHSEAAAQRDADLIASRLAEEAATQSWCDEYSQQLRLTNSEFEVLHLQEPSRYRTRATVRLVVRMTRPKAVDAISAEHAREIVRREYESQTGKPFADELAKAFRLITVETYNLELLEVTSD